MPGCCFVGMDLMHLHIFNNFIHERDFLWQNNSSNIERKKDKMEKISCMLQHLQRFSWRYKNIIMVIC